MGWQTSVAMGIKCVAQRQGDEQNHVKVHLFKWTITKRSGFIFKDLKKFQFQQKFQRIKTGIKKQNMVKQKKTEAATGCRSSHRVQFRLDLSSWPNRECMNTCYSHKQPHCLNHCYCNASSHALNSVHNHKQSFQSC